MSESTELPPLDITEADKEYAQYWFGDVAPVREVGERVACRERQLAASLERERVTSDQLKATEASWKDQNYAANAMMRRAETAEARITELEAERDRLRNAAGIALLALEPHNVPGDCWSTGPKTGDIIADHLVCPGCCALVSLRAALAASPTPEPK
jgi:hypothetical protein